MRSIGYRVRLPTELDNQREFICRYANYFSTFEVKVTDSINCTTCIESAVMLAREYSMLEPSYHIAKDTLYNKESFEKSVRFIEDLKIVAEDASIILVTHYMPEREYNSELLEVFNGTNIALALENVEVTENLSNYLVSMKKAAKELNSKVCMDLGHLLYSVSKCEQNATIILEDIVNDIWWKNNIVEFHLHDYNSQKCHLNIGKGCMNLSLIASFINKFPNIPIIIETTIDDLSVQGVKEVMLVKEVLAKYDNT